MGGEMDDMPTCTISYAVQCKAALADSLGCKREAYGKRGDMKARMIMRL